MEYNKIYQKNKDVWGKGPNKHLQLVWQRLDPGSEFLDLGCGQGRDSMFMAKQGFKVTAVDNSEEGIKALTDSAKEMGLEGIIAVCRNIAEFEIKKDKYSVVNIINALHFINKDKALSIIDKVKDSLKEGGFVIITGFTTQDPGFNNPSRKDHGYFLPEELLGFFSGYKIIVYEEGLTHDSGHPGFKEPHKHGFVRLVGQKVS